MVDGAALALVACDEHTQPALDALCARLDAEGREIGEICDLGPLEELESRAELVAALGGERCPWCGSAQQKHSQARPPKPE